MYLTFICSLFWLVKGEEIVNWPIYIIINLFVYNSTGLEYGDVDPLLQLSYPLKTVNILCKSFSTPEWFRGPSGFLKQKRITISRREHISNLTISSSQDDDSGIYKCVGTTDTGAPFEAKSELVVAGNSFFI